MLDILLLLQRPIATICAQYLQLEGVLDVTLSSTKQKALKDIQEVTILYASINTSIQASTYPSLNYAILHLQQVYSKVEEQKKKMRLRSVILSATITSLEKLASYKEIWEEQKAPQVAMIIDPRMKLNALQQGIHFDLDEEELIQARQYFNTEYTQFQQRYELFNSAAHQEHHTKSGTSDLDEDLCVD